MNLPTYNQAPDPWPEILHTLPQKITYKAANISGTPEQLQGFAGWLIQQFPAVVGEGDPASKAVRLLMWLRSLSSPYEADDATRMAQQAAVQQAPANPISHQTVPQQAQMAPPAPQPVAAAPAPAAAPAGEEPEVGPGMICPECNTKVSGVRGYKRHVTMTHKTEWPAFCTKYGLDQKTALPGGAPAPAQQSFVAPPPPPAAAPVPPMFGSQGPAQPFTAPAPPAFTPPPAPVPAPVPAQAAPAWIPPQGGQVMPQHMPAPAPVVQAAPALPPSAPGPMVAFNPAAAPAFDPVSQPQPASPVPVGGPSREDLARMLGGPVDLVVVRLLDAATVNLQGKVDVNQLAALAETNARAELKIQDLAQASYGGGKQAAQRHFAELLNRHPSCYLLQNGYEPIIPDGYLAILASRVTKFHLVTDGGRQTTDIF